MLRPAAILCLLLPPVGLFGSVVAEGASAQAEHDRFREEVLRLLGELDGEQFEVRRRAAARLEDLVAKPEWSPVLSAEFHRALLRPDVSFEVRWHLKRWVKRLPKVTPQPPQEFPPDALDRLMRQLDDDSYGARLAAARRLEWLLGNPKLICPVLIQLKRRLADPAVDQESRRLLNSTVERARAAWLLSDPAGWDLPPVSDEQINAWIDELVRPASAEVDGRTPPARQRAERELLDVLARDEYVPRVKQALEGRLDGRLDADATARVKRLLELTRPAMVAEYWRDGRHFGEQHLLIGVPSMGPGAQRPSHFDRIDDKTAHCVSGNNLSPGDWPVGVAFPHPNQPGAVFHLVNLSTPRRRMAYPYHAQIDEPQRLAALSRRTLDRMLAEKRKLTTPELIVLGQLDPREVSRFADKYFSLVEDEQLPSAWHTASGDVQLQERTSRFGMICRQLALNGTKEAVPGLLEAIENRRFLPPTAAAPYRLNWLAAVAISARDPWPTADAWLAGLASRGELLVEGHADGPELGATAAGVLLKRHQQARGEFGLQPAAEPLLLRFGIDGYRFESPDAHNKVQQWWQRERASQSQSE